MVLGKTELKKAVVLERQENARRRVSYGKILKKMKAYQEGTGPAPTTEDFNNWVAAVDAELKLAAIKSGFSEF